MIKASGIEERSSSYREFSALQPYLLAVQAFEPVSMQDVHADSVPTFTPVFVCMEVTAYRIWGDRWNQVGRARHIQQNSN